MLRWVEVVKGALAVPGRISVAAKSSAHSGQIQDVTKTEAGLGAFHFLEVIPPIPANPAENEG